jgi:hypothetical protein
MRRSLVLGALVALCCTGVALAAAGGTYTGLTNKKDPESGLNGKIYINVSGSKFSGYYTGIYNPKSKCESYDGPVKYHNIKIKHNNTFSASELLFAKDTLKISGKFSGSKVSGSFSETFTPYHKHFTCSTGKVTFTATKT